MKKIDILEGYTIAGFSLFPLGGNDGKKPLIKNWQNRVHDRIVDKKCITGNFVVTLQDDDLVLMLTLEDLKKEINHMRD